MKIIMRDMDNRTDDDGPFVFTGVVEAVVNYIDAPLRNDLSDPDIGGPDIDEAIACLRSGDIDQANALLNHMRVYLTVAPDREDHTP